jgi:hemerythrin-like domain-containing protein
MENERRHFLMVGAALGIGGLSAVGPIRGGEPRRRPGGEGEQKGVGAAEDLMREHGVLNRILLIFEEGLRRLLAGEDISPEAFHRPALLVRRFVEDYHERLEETFLFPAFEKEGKLAGLVKVLREQHQAGRRMTDVILRSASAEQFRRADARKEVAGACRAFVRMYRPHEAREDTVLFPALRRVFTAHQLRELGERFEKEEDKLFGEEGFERTVDQVAAVEKQLGIYDLSQFTPR